MKAKRKILSLCAWLLALLIVLAAAYLSYVYFSYGRMDDERALAVQNGQQAVLPAGKSLSVMTLDAGSGIFGQDFSYFMDGGWSSGLNSPDGVNECLEKMLYQVRQQDPGLLLLQQIDTDADRSSHVNERNAFEESLSDFACVYAENWDSPWILWPLNDPVGKTECGMETFSRYQVESAVRRTLPVSEGTGRFFDMDRCMIVLRMPVDNGRCLTLINAGLSPWLKDDETRKAQTDTLFAALQTARDAGDYVICGGGFARDLLGGESPSLFGHEWQGKSWCRPLEEDALGDEFIVCAPVNAPTQRDASCAYDPGKSYTAVTDGFIVSTDVTVVDIQTDDTGFAFSHHNPVLMKFRLE